MNFEPQKFFIGLIDFFSVLLPGAILAYLLKTGIPPRTSSLVDDLRAASGREGAAIFLVVGYLLGHFIFLLGAWLDEGYDAARKASLNNRIRQLAWRGTLRPRWQRALLWLVFKREQDAAVASAARIKETYLDRLQARSTVNTFQWAKVYLAVEHPESLATVQRFEADSKFFRSLSVVLILAVILAAFMLPLGASSPEWRRLAESADVSLVLLPLALWRYAEQRLKSTNQAYWAVITLAGREAAISFPARKVDPPHPTHAGGVVSRLRDGKWEYLLVEAKRNPRQWVLPKGHIEDGEHPRETAVREVHEETGVWARIEEDKGDLGTVSYSVRGEEVRAQFYLMTCIEERAPSEPGRKHDWQSLERALRHEFPAETRDVLTRADEVRRKV